MSIKRSICIALIAILATSAGAFAQAGPGGQQGGPGGPGGQGGGFGGGGGQGGPGGFAGGQISPAMIQQIVDQMNQRMLDNVKTQLGCTDDEFAVIGPKVQAIMALRFDEIAATNGRLLMRGIPGLAGGMPGGINLFGKGPGEMQKAATDLQTAVDDPNTTDAELASKVASFRMTHARVRQEIQADTDDLLQLLTTRQEAVLVSMGLIE
ncbi:MAG: hypothetical protein ABSG31_09345 [Tepidisphaeraceae bacterium]